ncbi:unnamed protein product [Caenorhabditis nigoni]
MLVGSHLNALKDLNSSISFNIQKPDYHLKKKYLEDKDIFVKFYTKHFCKRQLNEQSASDEAESSFISKFTECCGYEYTSRLAKMIQDTQHGNLAYYDARQSQFAKGFVEGFTEFNNKKFTGRKLSWVYNQSRGEITSTAFNEKKYVFGIIDSHFLEVVLVFDKISFVIGITNCILGGNWDPVVILFIEPSICFAIVRRFIVITIF